MDALDNILNRVSAKTLSNPIPSKDEMETVYKAALRAPDHAWLRTSSFIEVKEDNVTNVNFFFHKNETEVESDSLDVSQDIQKFASILGNLNGKYILPVIIELKNEDNSFKTELSLDGTFKINNVINGRYQLFAYQDRNNNSILDTGSLEKNINAEKFYVYPDSLTLRSNWELEIQDWNLDQ
mgnify:CR=1 FL=1